VELRGALWRSVALHGALCGPLPRDALRRAPWHFVAFRGTPWRSAALRSGPWRSGALWAFWALWKILFRSKMTLNLLFRRLFFCYLF